MNQQIRPDEFREMKDSLNLRKQEVETRISDLQRERENYVDFACDTLKLITDFKIKYLQGNAYLRKKLNSLLFKTISLSPRQQPGVMGERADCLYIEWNEPFATLFQNYKKWFLEPHKLEEASS